MKTLVSQVSERTTGRSQTSVWWSLINLVFTLTDQFISSSGRFLSSRSSLSRLSLLICIADSKRTNQSVPSWKVWCALKPPQSHLCISKVPLWKWDFQHLEIMTPTLMRKKKSNIGMKVKLIMEIHWTYWLFMKFACERGDSFQDGVWVFRNTEVKFLTLLMSLNHPVIACFGWV